MVEGAIFAFEFFLNDLIVPLISLELASILKKVINIFLGRTSRPFTRLPESLKIIGS